MPLGPEALQAIWLTLQLATLTTLVLLLIATPLAWWLSQTESWWKGPVGAFVTLPLVLPPSVLGFYLLVAMGPAGPLGQFTQAMGWGLRQGHREKRIHRAGPQGGGHFHRAAAP